MTSLHESVKTKVLDAIRNVSPGAWKALVVDEHSRRLLFNVLKSDQILEERVTAIFLNSDRLFEAHPDQEAIYILTPTTRNINRIIDEFSDGRQQFKMVHLFFTDSLAEDLFNRLTNSAAFPFLACVTELFINFWPVESRVFSIEAPEMFFSLYQPPRSPNDVPRLRERLMEDLVFAARHIANVCITMNEMPYIRFYQPQHHPPLGPFTPAQTVLPPPPTEGSGRWRTNLARGAQAREYEHAETENANRVLARLVQANLDEHQRMNPEFPKRDKGRSRGTLIITDRTMDTVAPFLHEITYQAMANDLLNIIDGVHYMHAIRSAAGKDEMNDVTLNDEDRIWVELRHMHMKDAIEKVMGDFQKFASKNENFSREGPADIGVVRDMMASMKSYQGDNALFSLHLSLIQKCMNMFDDKNVKPYATISSRTNIEQCCATGMNPEGKTPKTLVEEMVPILDSPEVSNWDKLRIVALYIQYREGVPEEDKRRLCQHARLSMADVDAINSLAHLGVRVTRGPGDKDIKKKVKARPKPGEVHDFARYNPVLEAVLEDQAANKLDLSVFPYFRDSPAASNALAPVAQPKAAAASTTSLRSTRPTWVKAAPPPGSGGSSLSRPTEIRPRILVFVAGGMTYSELRTCYTRADALRHDVVLGSTHALTPKTFMDDLKVLELGGKASRARAEGVGECVGDRQKYFDLRYPQPELGPPPPVRVKSVPAGEKSGWGKPGSGGARGAGGMLSPGNGGPLAAPQLQQTHSMSSFASFDSAISTGTAEKKKKFGIFRRH